MHGGLEGFIQSLDDSRQITLNRFILLIKCRETVLVPFTSGFFRAIFTLALIRTEARKIQVITA
jgi:hypothetical protein